MKSKGRQWQHKQTCHSIYLFIPSFSNPSWPGPLSDNQCPQPSSAQLMVSNHDSLRVTLASRSIKFTTGCLHHTDPEQRFQGIGTYHAILQQLKFRFSGSSVLCHIVFTMIHSSLVTTTPQNHPNTTHYPFGHDGHALALRVPPDEVSLHVWSLTTTATPTQAIKHEATRCGPSA